MPASDGSDDFVGVCDPMEGLRLGIVILEEAVDGGLEVGDGSEDAAFETALRQDGEKTLDAAGRDYRWHWRVHVGLWTATSALKLAGDFVECGVNRGFMSSAIMHLLAMGQHGAKILSSRYIFRHRRELCLSRRKG